MTVHKKNQYQHQVSTNINTGKKTRILTFCYETNPFFLLGTYVMWLFISLDHLNKLWIIRRFKTLPNTQNLLFNIYIISKSKHSQKEYMTVTSNLFLYFIFKPNHPPRKGSWMCTEWIIYVCWWHAICLFNMIADPCRTHYVH